MKVLRIDDNAHAILIKTRDELKESGIENATISEAIRELDRQSKFAASPVLEQSIFSEAIRDLDRRSKRHAEISAENKD